VSFFEELERETAAGRDYLLSAPIIGEVFDRRFSLHTYIAFLNQAYHHVRHTVPLLMLAGGRLAERQFWLQEPIGEYIREESGHEQWILNDIEASGFSRQAFAEGQAPFDSDVLASFLYDTVQRRNPVGIFGMVLVLEGTSASLAPEVARIVQEELALPDAAMTYLTSHGELDQDHIEYFETIMNRVSDESDQIDIIRTANVVYRLYGDVFRAIPLEAEAIATEVAA
jgi:hypothetical protein